MPAVRTVTVSTNSATGCGVRLSATLVLTCHHVIGRSDKPKVDGQPCLRVLARSAPVDLALLEVVPVVSDGK